MELNPAVDWMGGCSNKYILYGFVIATRPVSGDF